MVQAARLPVTCDSNQNSLCCITPQNSSYAKHFVVNNPAAGVLYNIQFENRVFKTKIKGLSTPTSCSLIVRLGMPMNANLL